MSILSLSLCLLLCVFSKSLRLAGTLERITDATIHPFHEVDDRDPEAVKDQLSDYIREFLKQYKLKSNTKEEPITRNRNKKKQKPYAPIRKNNIKRPSSKFQSTKIKPEKKVSVDHYEELSVNKFLSKYKKNLPDLLTVSHSYEYPGSNPLPKWTYTGR